MNQDSVLVTNYYLSLAGCDLPRNEYVLAIRRAHPPCDFDAITSREALCSLPRRWTEVYRDLAVSAADHHLPDTML